MKRRRKTPRPGRMTPEQLDALRAERWLLDSGRCHECGKDTIFNAPQEWDNSFHLAHVRGKRMHGDSIENTQTECGKCHRDFHQYGPSRGKPCPAKVTA